MVLRTLKIATRKSPLALWQANHVREQLRSFWPNLNIELLPMSTSGDKFSKEKLLELGGKGLFIKELEEAILDKRAHLAVHSMKDVPADFPKGLELSTICKRGNPFDALISNQHILLKDLPEGATIGTSSLRRQSQILAFRPDLKIKFLRGNINTRLQKLFDKEYDAIILAAAGLERMNMEYVITEILSEQLILPACGQGALGIECRSEDEKVKQLLNPLSDPLSHLCVEAERRVNARLGGNCHVPVAVFSKTLAKDKIIIQAKVCSDDGKNVISATQQGSINNSEILADQCAENLLDKGAAQLLSEST